MCFSVHAQRDIAIQVIPQTSDANPNLAKLGQKLFSEPLFSRDNDQACISCHQIHFSENEQMTSKYRGFKQIEGMLNTPTILNATYNFRQFWNGRVKTIPEAIDDHVSDKTIFNNDWKTIIERLKSDSAYSKTFDANFADGVTEENIEASLNTYVKTLITPNAPFDKYLEGDEKAISDEAKAGYQMFKDYGCISCHQGLNIGGNLFQKMGIYKDYFADRKFISQADLGLYNVTGEEDDKFVFKVPSLRNVARTAPYFHDGSAEDLKTAVQVMAEYQVGKPISNKDANSIIEFLNTLNGTLPGKSESKE